MLRPILGYNGLTTNARLKAQYWAACHRARELRPYRTDHHIAHMLCYYYGKAMSDAVMASLAPRKYAMLYQPLPLFIVRRGVRWYWTGDQYVTIPEE